MLHIKHITTSVMVVVELSSQQCKTRSSTVVADISNYMTVVTATCAVLDNGSHS